MTLKLVAQYGDAANIGAGDPGVIAEKCAILRRHCDDLGRDYDSVIKSTNLNIFPLASGEDAEAATAKARGTVSHEQFSNQTIVGPPDVIAARVEAALEAGADYVIFYVPGVAHDLELVERAEAVARRFA